jgi:hypothetical protein
MAGECTYSLILLCLLQAEHKYKHWALIRTWKVFKDLVRRFVLWNFFKSATFRTKFWIPKASLLVNTYLCPLCHHCDLDICLSVCLSHHSVPESCLFVLATTLSLKAVCLSVLITTLSLTAVCRSVPFSSTLSIQRLKICSNQSLPSSNQQTFCSSVWLSTTVKI